MATGSAGDCTGFALRIVKEMMAVETSPATYIHNGEHGAALYHYGEDNAYVLADSSARVSFVLRDGDTFVNNATSPSHWTRKGDIITMTGPDGTVREYAPVTEAEIAYRTNEIQFRKLTAIVQFR